MSDFVVHRAQRSAGTFARQYVGAVESVRYRPLERTAVHFTNGQVGSGSCLGCGSAPCMHMDDSEFALRGVLEKFPGDPSRDVCPTRAIRWDTGHAAAFVLAEDCIGCGLCISRCPYGAISLARGQVAEVAIDDPDALVASHPAKGEHPEVRREGLIGTMDAAAAAKLPEALRALPDARTNLLVRNLMIGVGLVARTRRRGDTNMRIDAVGLSANGRPFVAEIELGAGVLESPRALLEDVAVLHSRYGYAVGDIDPVSIILSFPNSRSEYYQVIRDIEKVLGLRCRTLTIGALVALLWRFARLSGFDLEVLTVGDEPVDLSGCLGADGANVAEPYPGAFRPAK